MGNLDELSELIEKMIRNPEGEAVYFGSLGGLTRKDEMRGKNLRSGAVYREVHE